MSTYITPDTTPLAEANTKVGPNRGKPNQRVWIEGQNVLNSGFSRGRHYVRHVDTSGTITLELIATADVGYYKAQGLRAYKVSGKDSSPIIDIVGKQIEKLYGDLDSVSVRYYAGSIEISR